MTVPTDAEDTGSIMKHLENREESTVPAPTHVGRKRTPDEWLQQRSYVGTIILDPDGWDRKNFAASWAERITETEFKRRLFASTCMLPRR